jgi:hydroxymethylpyrimidine pyrophosphatase-like HAD family hydrolase
MANAHPTVLGAAVHVAPANTEDGVLRTVRDAFDL